MNQQLLISKKRKLSINQINQTGYFKFYVLKLIKFLIEYFLKENIISWIHKKPKSVEQRLILCNNNKDCVRVNSSDASESSKSINVGGSAKLMQTNSFNADEDDTDLETDPTNEYKYNIIFNYNI